MSSKEVDRELVFTKVKNRELKLTEASNLLNLSYPQTKRIWSKYKKEGRKGLISQKRGKVSNRVIPKEIREEIASIVAREYQFCKPLFVSEKLKERHNLDFSSEFVRQVMIEYNLHVPKRKKTQIHQRRERRAFEGELIQIDASDHAWFEDRGAKCSLHLLVDDATSKIMGGYFAPEESTEGYYKACLPYFEKMGRPISLYCDKRGTFMVNNGKKKGKTQFARAMKELDIRMIFAHSPQAKGRIERAFGTLQERLVWEMRIHNISTIKEANVFLPRFFEAYNKRYSERPTNPVNAHRPLNHEIKLKYTLCRKEKRKVTKNLEVSFKNKIYQLHPSEEMKWSIKGSKITVITTLENELAFEYKGTFIDFMIYNEQPAPSLCINVEELAKNWKTRKKYKPSKYHPYRNIKTG
jgi:hypothetical protein